MTARAGSIVRADSLRPGDRWAMRDVRGEVAISWRIVRALRLGSRVTLVWDPPICGVNRETLDADRLVLTVQP